MPPTTTAAWKTETVASGGGTVTVTYRPSEVQYQAAVPAAGYEVTVERTSPEVRVEFKGENDRWDVRIRWNDGALDVDIGQSG